MSSLKSAHVRQYFPLPAVSTLLGSKAQQKQYTSSGHSPPHSSHSGSNKPQKNNTQQSIAQRMSVRGAHPLQRSSFFDQEAMQRTLDETEARLLSTLRNLEGLECSHHSLQLRHDSLAREYADMCDKAVALGWNYCPEKSSDFAHIPPMDPALDESSSQVCVCVSLSLFLSFSLFFSLPRASSLVHTL